MSEILLKVALTNNYSLTLSKRSDMYLIIGKTFFVDFQIYQHQIITCTPIIHVMLLLSLHVQINRLVRTFFAFWHLGVMMKGIGSYIENTAFYMALGGVLFQSEWLVIFIVKWTSLLRSVKARTRSFLIGWVDGFLHQ